MNRLHQTCLKLRLVPIQGAQEWRKCFEICLMAFYKSDILKIRSTDVTLKLEITLFVGLSEYLHLLLVHKIAIFLTKEDYFTYFVLKRLTTNL